MSKELKNVDILHDDLPYERALGVKWNVEKDCIGFSINLPNNKFTKRGILSTIFSVYDPLFIISPVMIPAKKLFQKACELKLGWDEQLPVDFSRSWNTWLEHVKLLQSYEIPRCYHSFETNIKSVQLHIFCDGSEVAYGCVAYLRYEYFDGTLSSNIVMAKVRLTPLNRTSLKTIPRIELNAAKLAVSLYLKIVSELEIKIDRVMFWCDSNIVLSYIHSDSARFQRFVSNRVAFIRGNTDVTQWNFVSGRDNPADLISRGTRNVVNFMNNDHWKCGPKFLLNDESTWSNVFSSEVPPDDDELKKSAMVTKEPGPVDNPIEQILRSSSCWIRLTRRIAIFLRFKDLLRGKVVSGELSYVEIVRAEKSLWKYLQENHLQHLYVSIANKKNRSNDSFAKLTPFVDREGLLRVGGRLENAPIPYNAKHPIILPGKCYVVSLYVRHVHRILGHMGRETILSFIRQNFHVIGIGSVVRAILRNCLICRKVNGKPSEQLMADLPEDRVTPSDHAFSNVGIDFFGPFLVSRGRGKSREKRYGVVFTCLVSRCIHIEIAHSLDTDSFINALRRFISRRGPIKLIRSDNGTNLVSGEKELRSSIASLNTETLENFVTLNQSIGTSSLLPDHTMVVPSNARFVPSVKP